MNRYNGFVRTDYIGLPVDSYHMAIAATEQEAQRNLDMTKLSLDTARKVEAVYTPDKQLKQQLLADVDSKIAELANENLTAPQTLMKLNSLVNDDDLINQLADIQGNTNSYKAAVEAAKAYQKEYGNDINLAQMNDQIAEYNKQGKDGFKSGFLRGYQPDKFIDVVGDIQKVLKDVKADSKDIENVNGQWIVRVAGKELPLEKLLKDAGFQLQDPKYRTQLQHLLYYNRRGLNDEQFNTFQSSRLQGLMEGIADTEDDLKKAKPGTKEHEKLTQELNYYNQQLKKAQSMSSKQFYDQNYLDNLALTAAQPYDYRELTQGIKANPFELAQMRANLDLRNRMAVARQKRQWQKEDQKEEALANSPVPTISSVDVSRADGGKEQQAAFILGAQGGYNMQQMAETIGFLLNSSDVVIDNDRGDNVERKEMKFGEKGGASPITMQNIKEAIKNGSAQVAYLPGTKEYMVTTSHGRYRVKSDLGMQTAMDPLYSLYSHDRTTASNPAHARISLDGKTESDVFSINDGNGNVQLFTPQPNANGVIQSMPLNKVDDKTLQDWTGIKFNSPQMWKIKRGGVAANNSWNAGGDFGFKGGNGIYVAYEMDMPVANRKEPIRVKKFETMDQYQKDYAMSANSAAGGGLVQSYMFMVKDGNMVPINSIDGGVGNQDLIRTHVQYNSQPDKPLFFTRDKAAMKTTKKQSSHSSGDSNSASASASGTDDDDENDDN